jgi:hypothetical protein
MVLTTLCPDSEVSSSRWRGIGSTKACGDGVIHSLPQDLSLSAYRLYNDRRNVGSNDEEYKESMDSYFQDLKRFKTLIRRSHIT